MMKVQFAIDIFLILGGMSFSVVLWLVCVMFGVGA
jgi:hypothetical protein